MFSFPQCICRCNNVRVIIDFCLYFRLGNLRIISESTKWVLRDNQRIKWKDDYYDDYDY